MNSSPETIARGVLTLTITKWNGDLVTVENFNIRVRNPNVIMTVETNPEVMAILYQYCSHRMSGSDYLLKSEAISFTDSDFYVSNTAGIFKGSNIQYFNEFAEFTGIKVIPAFCFSGCILLKEITLPDSIKEIKQSAFNNVGLDSLTIPMNVGTINQQAFESAKITTFTVDNRNLKFCSRGGNIYLGIRPETLYILAPGITEYVMPEETIAVFEDGAETWRYASKLTKITLNERVQGINGAWFKYGLSQLKEVTGPERNDVKFYNSCIYNGDYSKLIY